MYSALLHTHNLTRWLVLIAAAVALFLVYRGLLTRRSWTKTEARAGLAFVGLLDLQLLIGLVLYFVSPLVQRAFRDFGAAMADQQLRFFAVEHILIMLFAVVFAHVGSVSARRASADIVKYRRAAIWYSLAVLAILVAIPWWRPLFPGLA